MFSRFFSYNLRGCKYRYFKAFFYSAFRAFNTSFLIFLNASQYLKRYFILGINVVNALQDFKRGFLGRKALRVQNVRFRIAGQGSKHDFLGLQCFFLARNCFSFFDFLFQKLTFRQGNFFVLIWTYIENPDLEIISLSLFHDIHKEGFTESVTILLSSFMLKLLIRKNLGKTLSLSFIIVIKKALII